MTNSFSRIVEQDALVSHIEMLKDYLDRLEIQIELHRVVLDGDRRITAQYKKEYRRVEMEIDELQAYLYDEYDIHGPNY